MSNYRKKYIKHHGEVPEAWEIHHIDSNDNNHDIDNLIAIPFYVHVVIHKRKNRAWHPDRKQLEEMTSMWENRMKIPTHKRRTWIKRWNHLLNTPPYLVSYNSKLMVTV